MFNEEHDERSLRRTGRIREEAPMVLAPAEVSGSATSPRQTLPAEYLTTLKRHRLLIFASALGGMLLFMAFGLNSQPLYRARTSIEIQGLNSDFLDTRSVTVSGDNTAQAADLNLQTQIKLLQSETLLQQTVAVLEAMPHPATLDRDDLLSRLERTLHLPGAKPMPYDALVEDAALRVKVKPMGVTRLVEISCDSYNAAFSAQFCNTLTSKFAEGDQDARTLQARRTSDWLNQQAIEMRAKTQESENKLEAATGGNGLVLSTQSSTVGEERLRELQDELVKAQADRIARQADAQVASRAQIDTLPNVMDNPAYRSYQVKLAELRGTLASLVPPLTEENSKVIRLRSQIREAEAGLEASSRVSSSRQANEFQAARHREDLLAAAYRAQEASVSSDLQRAAQVSLLRREVESEQTLYQTLLQRSKEAGLASALQASTVRVVDTAQVPRIPFSPQRKLSAGAGIALGSLLGIGFAFYKDRSSRVFRIPGDVPRYLHVHELGVIPAAQPGNARLAPKRHTAAGLALQAAGETDLQPGRALTLARWEDDFSLMAEAYRNATFSILLSDSGKRTRTYVVSSPTAGEGKTTVTSNLGVALSKSKLRVVLIDGDLRKPSLHKAFGVPSSFGLRNILRGEVSLDSTPVASYAKRTHIPNLFVIPCGGGSEDIVGLLHSAYVGDLLTRLSHDFDIILIDTPPVLHMADARIFAGQSDGVIAVFRAGYTDREQAAAARDLFEHDGVRLVGTILNDFDPAREGKPGYYESYYRYHTHPDAVETATVGS